MAKRPVDIRRLRPTQLLRLPNSTALGPVMTRSQLRRQMDAAALRVGDGETVHLVRYTRWLVREYLRPPETREVGGYAAALWRGSHFGRSPSPVFSPFKSQLRLNRATVEPPFGPPSKLR